jgi:hypothetical protein
MESTFKMARDSNNLPTLLLKYDCQTRWGSSYKKIRRYQKLSKAYKFILSQEPNVDDRFILTKEEDDDLNEICEVLKVFYSITTWLCIQK